MLDEMYECVDFHNLEEIFLRRSVSSFTETHDDIQKCEKIAIENVSVDKLKKEGRFLYETSHLGILRAELLEDDTVYFIDNGNELQLSKSKPQKFYKMTPKYRTTKPFAYMCSVDDDEADDYWSLEDLNLLEKKIYGRNDLRVVRDERCQTFFECELDCSHNSYRSGLLIDILIPKENSRNSEEFQSFQELVDDMKRSKMKRAKRENSETENDSLQPWELQSYNLPRYFFARVTHVDKNGSLYVHQFDDANTFDDFQKQINRHCSANCANSENNTWVVSQACFAKHDDRWARGFIDKLEKGFALVDFVDFGFKSVVPKSRLRKADKFSNVRSFAVEIVLENATIIEDRTTTTYINNKLHFTNTDYVKVRRIGTDQNLTYTCRIDVDWFGTGEMVDLGTVLKHSDHAKERDASSDERDASSDDL